MVITVGRCLRAASPSDMWMCEQADESCRPRGEREACGLWGIVRLHRFTNFRFIPRRKSRGSEDAAFKKNDPLSTSLLRIGASHPAAHARRQGSSRRSAGRTGWPRPAGARYHGSTPAHPLPAPARVRWLVEPGLHQTQMCVCGLEFRSFLSTLCSFLELLIRLQ